MVVFRSVQYVSRAPTRKKRIADQVGSLFGFPIRLRQPVELPIFSIQTGETVDRYIWHNEYSGLACAATQSLTFIGQDDSTKDFNQTIFEASPGASSGTFCNRALSFDANSAACLINRLPLGRNFAIQST
jgi:hypothetical protein